MAPGVVVYSLIALNWADVLAAERDVGQIITDSGLPGGTRLHANAIFHGDKRKKTPWGELSKEQILQALEGILKSLKTNRAIFSLGVVDQGTILKEDRNWPRLQRHRSRKVNYIRWLSMRAQPR